MHSGYYEAILQLRNPPEKVFEAIDVFLKKKSRLRISNEIQRKDGVDLFLTSQHDAQRLGEALKGLGAKVTVSERIFSRNKMTSREVFRVTILARFPEYTPGDVVECEGKLVIVTSIGKRLCGDDLLTGKRVCLPKEAVLVPKMKTKVIGLHPHLTILDPETYQPAEAVARKTFHLGENVAVVRWKGAFYCL